MSRLRNASVCKVHKAPPGLASSRREYGPAEDRAIPLRTRPDYGAGTTQTRQMESGLFGRPAAM